MSPDGQTYLWAMYGRANKHDRKEGLAAYPRYNHVMKELSRRYEVPLDRVVAAFVSLSPNNDYISNLRSTASVLHGLREGWGMDRVQISTYRHCLERAWAYVNGTADFLTNTKGPKIRAFYHNVLDPTDERFVTIDGHMVAIWRNEDLTMREAIPKPREYRIIARGVSDIAHDHSLPPCSVQAILWHTRKRLMRIKHSDQKELWPHDEPNMLEPYPERRLGPKPVVPNGSRVPHLRGRPGAKLGGGESGGLSGMRQTSLALEAEREGKL